VRQIKYFFEYLLLAGLALVLAWLPKRGAHAVGRGLGRLYFRLSPFRRRVAEMNLKLANLDIGAALGAFENAGLTMVEFARFRRLRRSFFETEIEGADLAHLKKALEAGKGAILLTGHFGNWELLGAFIRQSGYPLDVVVKEQRNLFVDRWIDQNRMRQGVGIIKTGVAVRSVVRSLSEGRLVAFVSDQYVGEDGLLVNFTGRPTTVSKGPAAFAVRLGVPIATGFLVRMAPWKFKVAVFPLLWPHADADREEEILRLTQAYTSHLEQVVREHPDHYLWMHRKWKNLVEYKTGVLKPAPPVEAKEKALS
jgi:KDO2-lipid IV(A) lauroyltransferase